MIKVIIKKLIIKVIKERKIKEWYKFSTYVKIQILRIIIIIIRNKNNNQRIILHLGHKYKQDQKFCWCKNKIKEQTN